MGGLRMRLSGEFVVLSLLPQTLNTVGRQGRTGEDVSGSPAQGISEFEGGLYSARNTDFPFPALPEQGENCKFL